MEAMNYTIVNKHISLISAGDTIMHNQVMKTVCNSDIKNGFCEVTIFGDSYRLGTLPVQKVIIEKA